MSYPKTNKYIVAVLVILIALTAIGTAQEETISVKYISFIDSTSHMKIYVPHINPGTFVYIENYYQTDSYGNPKFYASRRFETATKETSIYFDLYRPPDRRGASYSSVETVIINNKQIVHAWTTDLTKYWN